MEVLTISNKELQINEEIRDREIRVVGADGAQLGIMSAKDALKLAAEKNRGHELTLYTNVERIGKELLMKRRNKDALSTNIDFYSGFVYEMLGLPMELYTPLFAVARISGWSAHRMEELTIGGKLIRPRYECVEQHRDYTPMESR